MEERPRLFGLVSRSKAVPLPDAHMVRTSEKDWSVPRGPPRPLSATFAQQPGNTQDFGAGLTRPVLKALGLAVYGWAAGTRNPNARDQETGVSEGPTA